MHARGRFLISLRPPRTARTGRILTAAHASHDVIYTYVCSAKEDANVPQNLENSKQTVRIFSVRSLYQYGSEGDVRPRLFGQQESSAWLV